MRSGNGSSVLATVHIDFKASWSCEVRGFGLAVTDMTNSTLALWSAADATLTRVALAPLTTPMGVMQSTVDGLLYVACFGDYPSPGGRTAGVAVVDPASRALLRTHSFSLDPDVHLHQVYEFVVECDHTRGAIARRELFVAVLGMPWSTPPVAGYGLVHFDRKTGAFKAATDRRLNVRSAAQPSPAARMSAPPPIYVVTEQPLGEQTILARLVVREAPGGETRFVVTAESRLPLRDGGDGGADVVLAHGGGGGQQATTATVLFATDRCAGAGKLHTYVYDDTRPADNFTRVATTDTGTTPVFTTTMGDDIVVCNQDDATLAIFRGFAAAPLDPPPRPETSASVSEVSFFLKSALVPETPRA